MFSAQDPARDITELLDYLRQHHTSSFIYRGQTKDYGNLVPSELRKKKIDTWRKFSIVSNGGYPTFSEVEAIKQRMMEVFIHTYDTRFGNYLAQQYLAQSEVIDISESLEVAAFFATMPYPHYNSPLSADQGLGVIYRFDQSSFETVGPGPGQDHWTGLRYARDVEDLHDCPAKGYGIYLQRETKNHWTPEQYYEVQGTAPSGTRLIRRRFATIGSVKTYSDMKRRMLHEHPTIAADIENVEKRNYGDVHVPVPYLRAIVQQGGIIRPPYLWSCLVPEQLHWSAAYVWGDYFMGVGDIYGEYGMKAFFFRHSGKAPLHKRNELWPNVGEDLTFFTLGNWVAQERELMHLLPGAHHMSEIVDIGYPENIDVDFSEYEPGLESW